MVVSKVKKERYTIFISPQLAQSAKAQAAVEKCEFSDVIAKALRQYLPSVISVINPPENISPIYQVKLDKAQQLISEVNLGTAPMNSLPATVTQKMAEGLKYQDDRKT